jgi:cell division septation protein DedD
MRQRGPARPSAGIGGNFALTRGILGVIAAAVALAMAVVVFAVLKSGGESAAQADATAIAQVGKAQDAEAQVDLQTAYQTAMTLYAEGGPNGLPSFTNVTAADLANAEPSLTYTDGVSSGPSVISVKGNAADWGAAALSSSGQCLWVHVSGGTVYFGSGSPCTGSAAMAAKGSSW